MVGHPMHPRVRRLLRLLKRLVSLIAVLVLLAIIAASIAGYLALTGKSLPLLRLAAVKVGELTAGQRVQQVTVDVRIDPFVRRLDGVATLKVQSTEAPRQRFYFLLNDGLHVRHVRAGAGSDAAQDAASYQFWLLTVVDVRTPVAKGDTLQLTFDYDGTPATGLFSVGSNVLRPRQVRLNVDSFWYPTDTQSFFDADITVTTPSRLIVVHNGTEVERSDRGVLRRTRWRSERPVAGVALIAGDYDLTARASDGLTYRVYLPGDVQLDAQRILKLMSDAHRALQDRYGPSGFQQMTMFVDRNLPRGFNDGSGLMGLSLRYFRQGDYGFATIAHEIAHDWWGDTVAEKWLSPGTGGEWLVEGFSEFSSLIATEAEYGPEALLRRCRDEFFDPDRHGVIAHMSVLDNVIAEGATRDTIYRKGAYAALMLRRILGDDAYFSGLRQFLDRFRFQQASDHDLQQVLQESTGRDLEWYFADWVRSDHVLDLSLDGSSNADVSVHNLGVATAPIDIDAWKFEAAGSNPPQHETVHVSDRVAVREHESALLDPQLLWADVRRENNRYPRLAVPLYVAASGRGDIAVTRGEGYPWARAAVAALTPDGRTAHTWEFTRGMAEPPHWAPDGSRLIASYSELPDALPAIVTLASEGSQRTIGHGTMPSAAVDGAVYAGSGDHILRFDPSGRQSTLVQHRGEMLDAPVASPDGTHVAYTAARHDQLEVRVIGRDGADDQSVLAWDRDRVRLRWSADGAGLYAAVGGSADWQIWYVPLGSGPSVTLAAGAAAIHDLALSPDGSQLAFTAAAEPDYPNTRCQLYVLNLRTRDVHTTDIPDMDLGALTWTDPDTILAVAAAPTAGQRWILPESRTLKRIRVSDGSVSEWP